MRKGKQTKNASPTEPALAHANKDGAGASRSTAKALRLSVAGQQVTDIPNMLQGASEDVLERLLGHTITSAMEAAPTTPKSIAARVHTLIEMNPTTSIEVMLANQMLAVNDLALHGIRPSREAGREGFIDPQSVDRAARLMKLFLEQVEAYQKIKGRFTQQRVTVEHVHVHEGGQAIVGTIEKSTKSNDGGSQIHEQQ